MQKIIGIAIIVFGVFGGYVAAGGIWGPCGNQRNSSSFWGRGLARLS